VRRPGRVEKMMEDAFPLITDPAKLTDMVMRIAFIILFAPTLQFPAVCRGQATVEGVVDLPKTHGAPVANERYEIVSEGGVLAPRPPHAVVYLEGDFARPTTLPTRQMAQKNLTFVPNLLPVERGTKVEFPNLDNTYHNIFSYSPAKRFDLGRYPPNEKPVPFQIFDRVGLVTVRCDIHEHMRALILVLDTPYFTISDAQGHYRLTNLPAGHFLLKAWISSKVTREHPVDLVNGALLHLDLP
jgi:plastocyanin